MFNNGNQLMKCLDEKNTQHSSIYFFILEYAFKKWNEMSDRN